MSKHIICKYLTHALCSSISDTCLKALTLRMAKEWRQEEKISREHAQPKRSLSKCKIQMTTRLLVANSWCLTLMPSLHQKSSLLLFQNYQHFHQLLGKKGMSNLLKPPLLQSSTTIIENLSFLSDLPQGLNELHGTSKHNFGGKW